jgi:hypothetical protein
MFVVSRLINVDAVLMIVIRLLGLLECVLAGPADDLDGLECRLRMTLTNMRFVTNVTAAAIVMARCFSGRRGTLC